MDNEQGGELTVSNARHAHLIEHSRLTWNYLERYSIALAITLRSNTVDYLAEAK